MISHGKRWKYAFRVFFSLIFHGRIAPDILADFATPATPGTTATPGTAARPAPSAPSLTPVAPPGPPLETSDRATQLLAILQRDGRLVDFLMEDLTPYQDAQIGAAVRDVHRGCRESLQKYAGLTPVLDVAEGSTVTVDRDSDPARVKVVGNAAGSPPYRGVLRHRGWEMSRLALPPLPAAGRDVVAPAEVEVA
jgi:hypothetical protein